MQKQNPKPSAKGKAAKANEAKIDNTIVVPKGTPVREETKMDALLFSKKAITSMLQNINHEIAEHKAFLKSELEKS